jgi:hypothetical protein
MAKWMLLLTTIPYVLGVLAVKLILGHFLEFNGVMDFSEVALVLTGGIFLIGFMLAGTMADYKESEKIPGEIACALETAEDTIEQACMNAKDPSRLDVPSLKKALIYVGETIIEWLVQKKTQSDMYASLNFFALKVAEMEKLGANGGACGKIIGDINTLRKITTRMAVISRTGFLATGYALLEVLIACIFVILMISRFKNSMSEAVVVCFVSLIYVYMYRLIKDVDDPFEYDPNGGEPGVTEIPLFPIEEFLERLKDRVEKSP